MLNPTDEQFIRELTERVTDAETKLDKAKATRDEGVRVALQSGAGATELTRITGLSRARIYQIRDGRR